MNNKEIILIGGGKNTRQPKKERNSNLELYRIILMLFIVAHHYVANSGLSAKISEEPLSANSMFYALFGAWGKTGINCFVLITGYFMCKTEITLRKFLKLLLWVLTYAIIITGIFTISGYTPDGIFKMWCSAIPLQSITNGFSSCFIVFYLCVPFLNILIRNTSQKQHLWLILMLLFIYTLHGSIPSLKVSMNYVSWFVTLYFISAYLCLYPLKQDGNVKFWGWMTAISWGLSIVSIICLQYLQFKFTSSAQLGRSYFLVSDSNSILALTNGITSFMWFKNLKIKNSKIINTIAASAFGVLLIHANSNTMRQWLWKDTIDCVGHYDAPYYWLYATGCVLAIYTICTIIDIIRIKTIETPLLNVTERFCLRAWESIRNKITIK